MDELTHLYIRRTNSESGSFLREDQSLTSSALISCTTWPSALKNGSRKILPAQALLHQQSTKGCRLLHSTQKPPFRQFPHRSKDWSQQRVLPCFWQPTCLLFYKTTERVSSTTLLHVLLSRKAVIAGEGNTKSPALSCHMATILPI
jgi:hypothetical protein